MRFADRRDNAFGTYKHFPDSLSFLMILVALISDTGVVAMRKCPTQTGEINHVDGVYHSQCHNAERIILEEQTFPRCGYCDSDTAWIFHAAGGVRKAAVENTHSPRTSDQAPTESVNYGTSG